jgi:hypothetical protein
MTDYDRDACMDVLAEMEEERLMEQFYGQQADEWNNDDQTLNEEFSQEESTQEEQYTGVDEEDDDDNASITTVVIHPSDTKTTGQESYVYCRPRPFFTNVIGYDSD